MQITPVSYNYTNSKVQKNNSKPAFGMAMMPEMQKFVEANIEHVLKLGAEGKQSLLDNIHTIVDHTLDVDVCKIFSPNGKSFHKVELGNTFDEFIDATARALNEYDTKLAHRNNVNASLSDVQRQLEKGKRQLDGTKIQATRKLLSGAITSPRDCQIELDDIAVSKHIVDTQSDAIEKIRGEFTKAEKQLGEFFPETVKPEEVK